jgi:hypothetical protein
MLFQVFCDILFPDTQAGRGAQYPRFSAQLPLEPRQTEAGPILKF